MFICTILIPVLLIGGIIYFYSYQQITQNYEHLSESKAMQVRSVLVATTLYLNNIYESLSIDNTLSNLLATDYKDSKEALNALSSYSKFNEILVNNAALAGLKLYIDQNTLKQDTNYSYFYPITESVKQKSWYTKAASTKGSFWKTYVRTGKNNIQYWELNYYCHIPIPQTGSYAVLVMTVSNNYLRSLINDDNYDIYVSVNSDPVFFSTDRNYSGNSFPYEVESYLPYYSKTGEIKLFGNETIASIQTLNMGTSDKIYVLAAYEESITHIHQLEAAFILAGGFALIISFLLITLYAGYFTARIKTLRLAMQKVARNDYEIVNSIQGDDELTATFQDLKAMVTKLKQTEAQIYESKMKEQILSNHRMIC
ncbi:MAG: hypothetical protein IAA25_04120 [Candidatus Ruminococcus intestinipullorum]|nr:hypothetical protein [Candidatus Ruminococcus intestinipullorum]